MKKLQEFFPDIQVKDLLIETEKIHLLIVPYQLFTTRLNYGYALFLYAHYFNHSCDPNAHYFTSGKEYIVRTARDIEPGEEITVAYDEDTLFTAWDARKTCVSDFLGCECTCERCSKPDRCELETKWMLQCNKPLDNQLLRDAILELCNENRTIAGISRIKTLDVLFNVYFPKSHSIAYEMYKKYAAFMLVSGEYKNSLLFFNKLNHSINEWKEKEITVLTDKLQAWNDVMIYFAMLLVIAHNEREKAKKEGRNVISVDIDPCYRQPLQKYFKKFVYTFEHVYDWNAADMDEKIYPFLSYEIRRARAQIQKK